MSEIGKLLLLISIIFLIIGLVLTFIPKFHLPGDITVKKNNLTIIIPVISAIIISILLTLIVNLFLI